MPKLADRVKEVSTTTGTGAVSMGGAAAGYRAFSAAFSTGDTVFYCIEGGAEWEVGIGTLTTGSPWTMARTTVLASSNAGAAVSFSAGTKNVFCTLPASIPATLDGVENLANKTLKAIKTAAFAGEYAAGNSGTSKAITWSDGQQQTLTLTGNVTLTFTWTGMTVGHYQLKLVQDATGSRAITWSTGTPGSTKWLGRAAAPAHNTTASSESLFSFYYDGTNAYGTGQKVGA
jgi:predicted secreted protein